MEKPEKSKPRINIEIGFWTIVVICITAIIITSIIMGEFDKVITAIKQIP